MRRHAKLIIAALACLVAAPAAGQYVGVLDQPFRNDPFQPLLEGRWSFTHYLAAGAENNTLGVGDMVALGYLSTDFRPSDIFLVAGLVPQDEGVRLGTQDRTGIAFTFPIGRMVTVGLHGAGRAIGNGTVPDGIAALLRDGNDTDSVAVDLTDMEAEAFAWAEGGANAIVSLPLMPTPIGDLDLLVGAGGRYVQSVSYIRVGFDGETGDDISRFVLTRDGVSGTLNLVTPVADEVLEGQGSTLAFDIMAGADIGDMIHVRAAITDIGSVTLSGGSRSITTMTLDSMSLLDMGTAMDSLATTDTVAGVEQVVSLPTTMRLDASFRPIRRVGVGLRLALPLGEDAAGDPLPAYEPVFQGALELRPAMALPLRIGILTGGEYGTGYFGGIGIETRTLRWDLELASTGGPAFDEMRGVSLRGALALRF